MINNTDDSTVTTNVNEPISSEGLPLTLQVLPRHATVGVDAIDTTTKLVYKTDQVCVTMKAQDIREDDERAPIDIMIALDVSGSMGGRKLALCKRTLETLVRVLLPQDRFGLVTYASDALIDLPLQRLTTEYRQRSLKTIGKLTTRGCTNISAALGLAAQGMRAVESPNPVRCVFLLTDGRANEGICAQEGLIQLARNCFGSNATSAIRGALPEEIHVQSDPRRFMGFSLGSRAPAPAPLQPTANLTGESHIPIGLHTFGYGADHNESLLQDMANVTEGGTYCFVEDDKSVAGAFGDALGGIVSVVAQNTVVRLHVPPEAVALGVKIDKVHHDQAILRENGSYTVTVGDFYAEETRDLVLTVELAVPSGGASNDPIPHIVAQLSYTDTLQRRLVESASITASVTRPAGLECSQENDHVAAQWLRVYSLQQMVQAEAAAAEGNYELARGQLACVDAFYHAQSPQVQRNKEAASVFQNNSEFVEDLASSANYRNVGAKRSKARVAKFYHQRATYAAPRSATTFASASGSASRARRSRTAPAGRGGAPVPVSAADASAQVEPDIYSTKFKSMWRQKFEPSA